MGIAILGTFVFIIILIIVNIRNRYGYYFILLIIGVLLALLTNTIEIARNSTYIMPERYFLHSIELGLYRIIRRNLRIPMSSSILIRDIGIFIYMTSQIRFIKAFCESRADSKTQMIFESKWQQGSVLFAILYFLSYLPSAAYRLYLYSCAMSVEDRILWEASWNCFYRILLAGMHIYLLYPTVILLILWKRSRISFFREQFIALAIAITILNMNFMQLFITGSMRISVEKGLHSGLWMYDLPDQIPSVIIIWTPAILIATEGIILFVIIRYQISDLMELVHNRMIRKSLTQFYRSQRDVLHQNKNLLLRIRILSEEAMSRENAEDIPELLQIQKICEENMAFIQRFYDEMKAVTLRRNHYDFLEIVRRSVQKEVYQKDIKCILDFSEQELPGNFDSYHLFELLNNLLGNAVEALNIGNTPEKKIKVEVRNTRKWIYCRISDNGPRIPEEIKRHIFEPFVSSKSKENNWGIGLSYVNQIVKAHMGHIRLKEQKGSEFCTGFEFIIPR